MALRNDNEESEAEGASTKTKNNDREACASTLPDGTERHSNPPSNRPVMYAAPPGSPGGPRSGGAVVSESAGGLVGGVGAQARAHTGRPVAAGEASRGAQQPAVEEPPTSKHIAIEEAFAFARLFSPTKDNALEAASTVLNAIEAERQRRHATLPKASSVKDYAGKFVRVEEAMEEFDGGWAEKVTMAVGRLGGALQSFTAYRSALKHFAVEDIKTSVGAIQAISRDHFGLLPEMITRLQGEMRRFAHLANLNRDFCLEMAGETKRLPQPKSRMLKHLRDGWREQFLEAVQFSDHAMPCALMNACGVRPVELQSGVQLAMAQDNVLVRINGGKVREHTGQPWREFQLARGAIPVWAYEQVRAAGGMTVHAEPEGLRKYIARVSEKLFPRHKPPKPNDVLLSPYVFRHAVVSDMRAEGWDDEDIAAAIGESSAATVAWYGLNWNAGGRRSHKARAVAIVRDSVQTARPVRPASSMDKSVLSKLKAARGRGAASAKLSR